MMELMEKSTVYLPKGVHWQNGEIHLFLDPEAPHWIATDEPGARLLEWIGDGLSFGDLIRRYSSVHGFDTAKAWLHVHDFVQALLRCNFASEKPTEHPPYLGRSAYAKPEHLKELWFHTNNICNLSCTHCLVSSAPWVKDWGLPTKEILRLVDEAVALGVDRFYMTGGEPFMREDLFELIRYITESKGCELILLTNAMLLSAKGGSASGGKGKRSQQLDSLNHEKVRFQVSLDGASAATNDSIRGKGSFKGTLEGLRALVGFGFEVSLTTVVTQANLKELTALTRLTADLGVKTQHLMWPHGRGRMVSGSVEDPSPTPLNLTFSPLRGDWFPPVEELIQVVRLVKEEADRLGVRVDNWESIKQRVNSRSGVKYDLGNACWDSLCIYSDGIVYPSAALVNVETLAMGSVKEGGRIEPIWRDSPVAESFRKASVAAMAHLAEDPLRYLTGGGDLEHILWFNQKLAGPDPYYPLYSAMIQDAMWEIARTKEQAVNLRGGYSVPRILHAMGEGAIHCATDDLSVTGEVDIRTLHSNCVLAFDVDKPRRLVREFYGEAAQEPKAELCCPTKFDDSMIGHIPKEVIDRFYGCGSPVTLGDLKSGETMVDLGSGAGIDCFIAAKLVGPAGRAIGVDMTDPMLEVANRNHPLVAANLGYDVVEFRKGFLESVPVDSKSADLVTSNCVINLSPDKPKVFAEIWRILKDHGRVVIADIVSDRPVPAHLKVNPRLWGECTVGALTEEEFLSRLEEAGFYGLSILKKSYWRTIPAPARLGQSWAGGRPGDHEAGGERYDFYSVTVKGYKFEKTAGCQFIGQKAIYLGPMKAVMDEEGHLFPRNVEVEVCTDTAAKLSHPPYAGWFVVSGTDQPLGISSVPDTVLEAKSNCTPGCC